MPAPSPKSRGRRLRQNLALSFVVFLLCGLVCEIALRFAGYGNLEIYEPDARLYWKLRPNQDCFTKVDHRPVHVNAQGTRGPEFQIEKPAGTFRILSLGDSRTFGWGLADEETYSRRVEKLVGEWVGREHPTSNIQHPTSDAPLTPALSPSEGERENRPPSQRELATADDSVSAGSSGNVQRLFPLPRGGGEGQGEGGVPVRSLNGSRPLTPALSPSEGERGNRPQSIGEVRRVEVINAGVNAWSYPQMAVYFRDAGLRFQPDVVMLAEANLWTQFSEKNDPKFVEKFLWRVRLKNFLRRFAIYHYVVEVQLQDFYQRHRTKFIPVDPQQDALFKEQQQTDPDAVFRTAIEDLCRTARSNHVQPVLLFLPTLDDLQSTNLSRVLRAKLAVSAALKVPLAELTPGLSPQGKALYLEADPVHLNARGNEIVAQRVFETLTNLIVP